MPRNITPTPSQTAKIMARRRRFRCDRLPWSQHSFGDIHSRLVKWMIVFCCLNHFPGTSYWQPAAFHIWVWQGILWSLCYVRLEKRCEFWSVLPFLNTTKLLKLMLILLLQHSLFKNHTPFKTLQITVSPNLAFF